MSIKKEQLDRLNELSISLNKIWDVMTSEELYWSIETHQIDDNVKKGVYGDDGLDSKKAQDYEGMIDVRRTAMEMASLANAGKTAIHKILINNKEEK